MCIYPMESIKTLAAIKREVSIGKRGQRGLFLFLGMQLYGQQCNILKDNKVRALEETRRMQLSLKKERKISFRLLTK